ncbi:MAG: hypothetical protein MZV49_00230 [Rhodopseudomonas palustris]|nr:hypothetical protein [Rhodopseudomonas palustris]
MSRRHRTSWGRCAGCGGLLPDNHHYPSFYSNRPLKEAIAGWYRRRFGVALRPGHRGRSTPARLRPTACFIIHTCLLDPGDIALVPDPCLPGLRGRGQDRRRPGARRCPCSGRTASCPIWTPSRPTWRQARAMIWVNYPNNPTAAVATPGFYRRSIEWARALRSGR